MISVLVGSFLHENAVLLHFACVICACILMVVYVIIKAVAVASCQALMRGQIKIG